MSYFFAGILQGNRKPPKNHPPLIDRRRFSLRHRPLYRSCHVNRRPESRKIRMPSRSRHHFRRTHPSTSTHMRSVVARSPLLTSLPQVQQRRSYRREPVCSPAVAPTMPYRLVQNQDVLDDCYYDSCNSSSIAPRGQIPR